MKKNKEASISLVKILVVSLIFIFLTGIGVMATSAKLTNVKIILGNDYEMHVLTGNKKVEDILKEKNVELAEDETVTPGLEEELRNNKTIVISKVSDKITVKTADGEIIASDTPIKVSTTESKEQVKTTKTSEEVLSSYDQIVEKIIIEEDTIPFETVTKEVGDSTGTQKETILQEGEDGIKQIKYKVKYQNDVEIEKTKIEETITKEMVPMIKQIKTTAVVNRSAPARTSSNSEEPARAVTGTVADYQEYARQRCEDYGWSDGDFNNLVKLWNRESGWNVTAYNRSSGAYGIPQALPGSKMSSAGSDWRTNYETQIEWGLSYIAGRYGTPTGAWNHSQRTGWY